jgi:HEAT repeat protein
MRTTYALVIAAGTILSTASTLAAQPLARRIAAAPEGRVVFRFASRPGICGDGDHIMGDGGAMHIHDLSHDRGRGSWRRRCVPGPVRVALSVRGGRVVALRTFVGESTRPGSGTDLGTVGVREATDYLLELAQTATGSVSEDAILPAAFADSVTIWPALLRIARDDRRPHDAREQATFWLSQFAADRALGPDDSEDESDDEDESDREQAVFALSQLDRNAGVPALLQVARSHPMAGVRRKALFWLGQSGDERALTLFEELLKGS